VFDDQQPLAQSQGRGDRVHAAGNFLGFGVVVPLSAVAILTTRALPRWIGWLGLLVGALAGWLGLLSRSRYRSVAEPS
jgi:hypothetical protein